MTSAIPLSWALVALLAPPLVAVLLYLLKPPARWLDVPSLVLWRRLHREVLQRRARRRWWLSLALSILILGAVAAALADLGLGAGSRVPRLLVVDTSASMAAEVAPGSERSRLDHARRLAEGALDAAPLPVWLADTGGRMGVRSYRDRDAARRALADLVTEPRRLHRLPTLPAAMPPELQVHLFSDGVSELGCGSSCRLHPVGEPVENVGITRLAARRAADHTTEVLIELLRAADEERLEPSSTQRVTVRLRLETAAGSELESQTIRLGPGESWRAVFRAEALDRRLWDGERPGLLRAVVGPAEPASATDALHDALPLDDTAWITLPPPGARPVVYVGPGTAIPAAIEAHPALTLVASFPGIARVEAADRTPADPEVVWIIESAERPRPLPAPALWLGPRTVPAGWTQSEEGELLVSPANGPPARVLSRQAFERLLQRPAELPLVVAGWVTEELDPWPPGEADGEPLGEAATRITLPPRARLGGAEPPDESPRPKRSSLPWLALGLALVSLESVARWRGWTE